MQILSKEIDSLYKICVRNTLEIINYIYRDRGREWFRWNTLIKRIVKYFLFVYRNGESFWSLKIVNRRNRSLHIGLQTIESLRN